MMSIRIILKSGKDFVVKCTKFNLEKNGFGNVTGYEIEGIEENKPIYLDFSQVAAIARVMSDESDDITVNDLKSDENT